MKMGKAASKKRIRYLVAATVILSLVIAVSGAAAYMELHQPPPLDSRLCPASGPTGHIVLVVDKTDPLGYTQKQAFHDLMDRLVTRGVPPGYLLSVFALDEDFKANSTPLLEECNPGNESGKSEWTNNLAHLRKRFEEDFRTPMLRLEEQLESKRSETYSPVFEMLDMASINGFRKQNVNGPRHLIVVSDMLHNTPEYSMYRHTRDVFDFARFRESNYGRKVATDLNGVDVELDLLLTTPALQTRRQLKFWEDFFTASGAKIASVRPLEG
jgi:hypothetical protein